MTQRLTFCTASCNRPCGQNQPSPKCQWGSHCLMLGISKHRSLLLLLMEMQRTARHDNETYGFAMIYLTFENHWNSAFCNSFLQLVVKSGHLSLDILNLAGCRSDIPQRGQATSWALSMANADWWTMLPPMSRKTLRTHTTGCLDMYGTYQLQVKTVSSCKFYSILMLILLNGQIEGYWRASLYLGPLIPE